MVISVCQLTIRSQEDLAPAPVEEAVPADEQYEEESDDDLEIVMDPNSETAAPPKRAMTIKPTQPAIKATQKTGTSLGFHSGTSVIS